MNSNHHVVKVTEIQEVYDDKTWLKPCIDTPHRHTSPHNFLFRRNQHGKAEMLYRNWSSDAWMPQAPKTGLVLLKVSILLSRAASYSISLPCAM